MSHYAAESLWTRNLYLPLDPDLTKEANFEGIVLLSKATRK